VSVQPSLAGFSDLYRRHSSDVYRFALSLCRNEAQAEDLVSEAFLRAWSSPVPLRIETVRSYLIAIARNVFLEGLRKARRERPLDVDVPDPRNAASEHEVREQWTRLQPLRAELPETTRSALIMQSVLEMPYAEIEAVLGVPAAALKVRVCRARVQLAEKLGWKEGGR
jgi:RNA polymerase sigma-70 factor (ECF subfamily)